ncbi:MAG TPA: limonene-1,2-epoxide hydrolase family protein [Dehalococcoidia bacterium]|nr:limonene-1,2-epoxide hydrolase family protein [Dehalococcoidia bacterium]
MSDAEIETIRRFCDAFARRDPDELLTYFTEDAVYHNMPGPPVQGKAAIRAVLQRFLGPAQSVEFVMLGIAADGNRVFTERLDRFVMGERTVELPVAGVFELDGALISAWRDYFDMATWTRQMAAASG